VISHSLLFYYRDMFLNIYMYAFSSTFIQIRSTNFIAFKVYIRSIHAFPRNQTNLSDALLFELQEYNKYINNYIHINATF